MTASRFPRCDRARAAQAGFACLVLLIALAILGIAAAASIQLGALVQRRWAEQALLTVGMEFQLALQSYAAMTPAGQSPHPKSLQDLLRDPRFPGIQRHLRRIREDPVSGQAEWGLVTSVDGGIAGIYSLSERRPIKQCGFEPELAHLGGRRRYSDWVFGPPPAGLALPAMVRAQTLDAGDSKKCGQD
jgi:type II secretory pathway pseudopilin PulG